MNDLVVQVIDKFTREGWTLATAESCTGGLLADMLTDIEGASNVFLGGTVPYSFSAKNRIMGVQLETLNRAGTISRETTLELAQKIKSTLNATIGVGITGIAGDSIEGKVHGLVYIAIATPNASYVREFHFLGLRRVIKEQAARTALQMILDLATH